MKEYPAYARAIAQHLVRGEKPLAIAVVLSNRWWGLLDHVPKVCIRADDWARGRYEFGYLHGMHVVAYPGDCEDQAFGELLLELMAAMPSTLWAFDLSGAPLSAEEPANELGISAWAAKLAGLTLRDPLVQLARARYAQGIVAAARAELDEFERIRERRGDEAAVRWHAARAGWPALVRQRFGAQLQEPSAQPA